ncbi:mitochondrial nucleoid-associated protein 1 [Paroedura picta]|uniref:mitochondrial nucleoid-associated protein 1 n=1 Tax=Paroedura picta TaxID=143630 RepID=UPI0040573975
MKSIPAAVEICHYCKKPFKRLKSHLPHCKMAGDASLAVNSTEISSPVPVTGNSATPECLNTKKKGQIKSTETASKKAKQSKPKPIGKEGKVKKDYVEPMDKAPVAASPDEDIQQQTKHSTKKSQKRENGTPRAPEEDLAHTQAAEKELSKTKLFNESPRIQKSRNTFEEEKFASVFTQEPLIQTGKATSTSPSQPIKKTPAKQRQAKERSAKLTVSKRVDSSIQSVPQEVELVIENYQVRVLRKRQASSVQNIPLNQATIGNQKMGHQPVESLSASADIPSATEKQIITGIENRVLSLELEGNTWTGETGSAVKASDECFVNPYRMVVDVPVQLPAGAKCLMDKNQLSVISHEETLVINNPKSDLYPTITEILQRRGKDEIHNFDVTSLGKNIAVDSGVIITRDSSSGISLKPPSVHLLEITSPKRGLQSGSLGLEWFPELYPNYQNIFLGKQKQQDTRIPQTQDILPHEYWQAWSGYNNRYNSVKKGRLVGISMLLLGYCALSYAWSYKDTKQNR